MNVDLDLRDLISAIQALTEATNTYEKRLEKLATEHQLQELRYSIGADIKRLLDSYKAPRFILLTEGVDEPMPEKEKKGQ
jgi:hypothetical protein